MVLSVYDIEDYRAYFDVHPLRKIANETNGYDCLLMGTRLGIGFIKDGKVIERPQFELDVKGKIRCIEILTVSDERAKECIQKTSTLACADIARKVGVYNFRMKGDDKEKYGFVAQDVEKLLPEAVKADQLGDKAIDNAQLLAIAFGAIKQLQDEVVMLRLNQYTFERGLKKLCVSINEDLDCGQASGVEPDHLRAVKPPDCKTLQQ